MKKQKKEIESEFFFKRGFTLVELLIVIAIIGVLAGVVMINSGSGVEKAKRASALSTMASIMPELVTCQDDGGVAGPVGATNPVCYADDTWTTVLAGHSVQWPEIFTKTGWNYGASIGDLASGNFKYIAQKTGQTEIACFYATGDCN